MLIRWKSLKLLFMAKFQIFVDVLALFSVSYADDSLSKQFSASKIKQPALKRQQHIFQGHHRYDSIRLLKLLLIRESFLPTMVAGTWTFVSPVDCLQRSKTL